MINAKFREKQQVTNMMGFAKKKMLFMLLFYLNYGKNS